MTSKKMLDYLEARLESLMDEEPDKYFYLDDKEYELSFAVWDANVYLLSRIIETIKQYDTDKGTKEYVKYLIKDYKKKE